MGRPRADQGPSPGRGSATSTRRHAQPRGSPAGREPEAHPLLRLSCIHPFIHIDRLLALQEKVERNSQAVTRLKTIRSFVAAGIALVVAALKDWLFGQK